MTDHPIAPPTELVQQWIQEADGGHDPRWQEYEEDIAARAAQWGADQELEACIAWMTKMGYWGEDGQAIPLLRAARRPKPPSAVEQAKALIESHEDGWCPTPSQWNTIREGLAEGLRALEAVPTD